MSHSKLMSNHSAPKAIWCANTHFADTSSRSTHQSNRLNSSISDDASAILDSRRGFRMIPSRLF